MSVWEIAVLDPLVADQIAAGEVVERPGSVVKELVENALDAGATKVQLDIEAGGVRRIRVLDNGAGLDPDKIALAFERHATSKIRSLKDLDNPLTYGFRGEALSSIASVARIEVRTRRADDVAGRLVRFEGGEVVEQREVGCPVGTDIEVKDLFYNTPARLKFLKKETTEATHCAEALVRLATCRPEVSFTMKSGGRKVRELPKVERIEERVSAMFAGENLVRAEGAEAGVEVLAVLGPPERARAGAGSLYTYVANRFMRDKTILRAVTQAFGGTLERGRYPVGLIALKLPPGAFDVNVHPQKTEVRFVDPGAVFRAISRVVGEMVATAAWTLGGNPSGVAEETRELASPPVAVPAYRPAGRLVPPPQAPASRRSVPETPPQTAEPAGTEAPVQTDLAIESPSGADAPSGRFSRLKLIGQAKRLFLLFETEEDLVVVDQHAAHERVTYEKLREQLGAGKVVTQRLLMPHVVDLGPSDAERIDKRKEDLSRLGLEVSRSGPDRVTIHGVPAELVDASPDRLLADMVIALEEGRAGSRGETDDAALAKMACHGSIRGGREVTEAETEALLKQMDQVDFAGHCPHGRPVLTHIPWRELERRLLRG